MIVAARKEAGSGQRYQHDFRYIFSPREEVEEDNDEEGEASSCSSSSSSCSSSNSNSNSSSSSSNRGIRRFLIRSYEDTEKVDGIGGTNWDGSIVMSYFLQKILEHNNNKNQSSSRRSEANSKDDKDDDNDDGNDDGARLIVELGCGAGLCSLVSYLCGTSVICTDRYTDLAMQNVSEFKQMYSSFSAARKSESKIVSGHHPHHPRLITTLDLEWGEKESNDKLTDAIKQVRQQIAPVSDSLSSSFSSKSHIDCPVRYIIGSEITCLNKQHDKLIETIRSISTAATYADSNPSPNFKPPLVLLSFDGTPATLDYKYYHDFLAKMKTIGYSSSICIGVGKVVWDYVAHSGESSAEILRKDYSSPLQIRDEEVDLSTMKVAKLFNMTESFIPAEEKKYDKVHIDLSFLSDGSSSCSSSSTVATSQIKSAEVTSHQIIMFFKDMSIDLCSSCGFQFVYGFRCQCK